MTRDELIAALEAAEGPSRELDFWCWWYGKSTEAYKPNPRAPDADYVRDNLHDHSAPHYTASIDAALTLVPEGWMVEMWLAQPTETQQWDSNATVYYERRTAERGEGKTAAIALCIAALKARAA